MEIECKKGRTCVMNRRCPLYAKCEPSNIYIIAHNRPKERKRDKIFVLSTPSTNISFLWQIIHCDFSHHRNAILLFVDCVSFDILFFLLRFYLSHTLSFLFFFFFRSILAPHRSIPKYFKFNFLCNMQCFFLPIESQRL